MSDLLLTIPFDRVREIVESLGADINRVVSVTFGTTGVTVVEVRTDPETGRSIVADNDVATVSTVIGYDRTEAAA